ncbi:MAG TPA: hypothetical protein VF627_16070 [Abditibacterium sp.]|jgi:hypothetical protein
MKTLSTTQRATTKLQPAATDEWQLAAEQLRELYAASIEENGEMTAFATADAAFHEYNGHETAIAGT